MSLQRKAGMMACLVVLVATGAVQSESPEHASTVPITRVGNAIFVQAKIAEQTPVNLLVDSAASATLILDRTLANHMRLPARGAENLKGAGKDECPAAGLAATPITVGDKTLSVSNPFATDLSHITRFLKRRTDGAIGGNLFRGQVVTLDFSRNLLTISSTRLASQDQESMPMFSLGNLCCAIESDLEVNGRTFRGTFVLDTGAPTIEVALTRSFALGRCAQCRTLRRNLGRSVPRPFLKE